MSLTTCSPVSHFGSRRAAALNPLRDSDHRAFDGCEPDVPDERLAGAQDVVARERRGLIPVPADAGVEDRPMLSAGARHTVREDQLRTRIALHAIERRRDRLQTVRSTRVLVEAVMEIAIQLSPARRIGLLGEGLAKTWPPARSAPT